MHVPGYAFYNNIAMMEFVKQVLARSGRDLLVHTDDRDGNIEKDLVYAVDTGVYTKNRHFRLPYSCKGGKTAVLMPTLRFAMNVKPSKRPPPAEIFLKGIVTETQNGVTLLSVRHICEISKKSHKLSKKPGNPTTGGSIQQEELHPGG